MTALDRIGRSAITISPVLRHEARIQALGWRYIGSLILRAGQAAIRPTAGLKKLAKPGQTKAKNDSPILAWLALSLVRSGLIIGAIWVTLSVFDWYINLLIFSGVARTLGGRSKAAPARASWKTDTGMTSAMIRATIIPKAKDGEAQKVATVKVTQDDEYGTTVAVRLPSPLVIADVKKSEARLGREIGKPSADLEIGVPAGRDDGSIEIFAAKSGRKSALVQLPDVTDVYQPIKLGRDRRGGVVDTRLILPGNGGQCVLIGGMMGSGKSYLIRRLMAHYLLDPAADVHVYGGKGIADFDNVKHACLSMYSGYESEGIQKIMAAMEAMMATVIEHNSGGRKARPTLLVLDEFQTIFSALNAKELESFETLLYRLMTESRAAYFSVILASQQLRADTIPKKYQALCAITISLQCRNGDERIIHGESVPAALSLPRSAGQAIKSEGRSYQYVQTDHLTDQAWAELGNRLPAVSATPADQSITPDQPVITDPLIEFTRQALASCGELSASELLPLLPERLRPADAARLGQALGKHNIRPIKKNKRRVYNLASLQGGQS